MLYLLSKIAQSDALQSDESRDSSETDVIVIPHPPKTRKQVIVQLIIKHLKVENIQKLL